MENARELLGINLKRLREIQGLTQTDLAEAAELSVKMIQKIEYGRTNPSTKTLDELSRALNCHPSELLAPETAYGHFNERTAGDKNEKKSTLDKREQQSGDNRRDNKPWPKRNIPPIDHAEMNAKTEQHKVETKDLVHDLASEIAAKVITGLKSEDRPRKQAELSADENQLIEIIRGTPNILAALTNQASTMAAIKKGERGRLTRSSPKSFRKKG